MKVRVGVYNGGEYSKEFKQSPLFVKTAFLHLDLEENIYMVQPEDTQNLIK